MFISYQTNHAPCIDHFLRTPLGRMEFDDIGGIFPPEESLAEFQIKCKSLGIPLCWRTPANIATSFIAPHQEEFEHAINAPASIDTGRPARWHWFGSVPIQIIVQAMSLLPPQAGGWYLDAMGPYMPEHPMAADRVLPRHMDPT